MEKINLYRAIDKMREISADGGSFSMKYRKWNRDTRSGGEIVSVAAARLRPRTSDEEIKNSSYKLFYTDTDTGLARNCWQPLILEFDGKRTVLD